MDMDRNLVPRAIRSGVDQGARRRVRIAGLNSVSDTSGPDGSLTLAKFVTTWTVGKFDHGDRAIRSTRNSLIDGQIPRTVPTRKIERPMTG